MGWEEMGGRMGGDRRSLGGAEYGKKGLGKLLGGLGIGY